MPRRPHEFYETPPHYTRALLKHITIAPSALVFEPCVGDGSIIKALPTGTRWTNDIDPARSAYTHLDTAKPWLGALRNEESFDWTITNPPFSLEEQILEQALIHSRNVAFLARLSFLEPTGTEKKRGRRDFFKKYAPPSKLIVLPRYSFRNNDKGKKGSDSVTCCWMVWSDEGPSGIFIEGDRS